MADRPRPDRLKVVLVGDSGVGKTSIFHLFDKQEVERITEATIGMTMRIKAMVATGHCNITVQLEVYDTAGEEKLRSITRQFYRNADVAIFVYDITKEETFHHVEGYWKEDVLKNCENDNIKMILIGNKTDDYLARQIEQDMIQKYANNKNMMFFEMSAHNPEHFNILCDAIRNAVGQVMAEGGSSKYRTYPIEPIGERLVINVPIEAPPVAVGRGEPLLPIEDEPRPQPRGRCAGRCMLI